ncbi:MAG: ribulose-phosphate 3-epimerase [Bacteroidales bacterium]|nr:ribulose-phosphate 3-epimerase [Bacteroidales bacterium]
MKYKNKISVSVMCADLLNLESEIRFLEDMGVDMLHIDVMDAHFVPNLTFGHDFIKAMQKKTKLPLDSHFMVTDPELAMERLGFLRPGDGFTAHAELLDQDGKPRSYEELSKKVRGMGAFFGLGLSPDTPPEVLERNVPFIDAVLLMLVYPGFAGSRMVEGIMDKVARTREWLDSHGREDVEIIVDGAVSPEGARDMAAMGASIFVGGTAGIYRKGMVLEETIPYFRKMIG